MLIQKHKDIGVFRRHNCCPCLLNSNEGCDVNRHDSLSLWARSAGYFPLKNHPLSAVYWITWGIMLRHFFSSLFRANTGNMSQKQNTKNSVITLSVQFPKINCIGFQLGLCRQFCLLREHAVDIAVKRG